MITDAKTIEPGRTLHTDVCIVGAGPAGLTLARELAELPLGVVVLERGDRAAVTPQPTDVANQGLPYDLSGSRRYGIGGTAWAWDADLGSASKGAQMLPFDAEDFVFRDWIPNSGWPFGLNHLKGYFDRAYEICRLDLNGFEEYQRPDLPPDAEIGLARDRIVASISSYAASDLFAFDFVREVEESRSVGVVCNATAVALQGEGGRHVESVNVVSANVGSSFSVEAKLFVLAAGGIENPRLLLESTSVMSQEFGNCSDLVGRFFMEHPKGEIGVFAPAPSIVDRLAKYLVHSADGYPKRVHLKLHGQLLARERLQACRFGFWPTSPDWLDDDLREVARRCMRSRQGSIYAVSFSLEQAPDRSNRITLGERLRDGTSVPTLEWRLRESDYRSLIRSAQLLQEEIHLAGAGDLFLRAYSDHTGGYEVQNWRGDAYPISGSHHHMGTTRMDNDPAYGVVNASCRVHGTDNLFVAGSSVFPTGSHANPTLTIVALSIRLAEHLKDQLRRELLPRPQIE